MVCEITEDIRKLVGDEKLNEVGDYVRKRMNYSFEAGKKQVLNKAYAKGFNIGWKKAIIWVCKEYNLDLEEVQFRETMDERVENFQKNKK